MFSHFHAKGFSTWVLVGTLFLAIPAGLWFARNAKRPSFISPGLRFIVLFERDVPTWVEIPPRLSETLHSHIYGQSHLSLMTDDMGVGPQFTPPAYFVVMIGERGQPIQIDLNRGLTEVIVNDGRNGGSFALLYNDQVAEEMEKFVASVK